MPKVKCKYVPNFLTIEIIISMLIIYNNSIMLMLHNYKAASVKSLPTTIY